MSDRELIQQWLQPGAIVPVDANTTRTLITALRERLAQPEQEPFFTEANGFPQTFVPKDPSPAPSKPSCGRRIMSDIETLRAAAERIAGHNIALRNFMLRLLDPEDLGHAVSPEVRQKAQTLLSLHKFCPPCNGHCRQGRDCPNR